MQALKLVLIFASVTLCLGKKLLFKKKLLNSNFTGNFVHNDYFDDDFRIMNGDNATDGEFPFVVVKKPVPNHK